MTLRRPDDGADPEPGKAPQTPPATPPASSPASSLEAKPEGPSGSPFAPGRRGGEARHDRLKHDRVGLDRFGLDDGSWQERAARALESVELGTLAGYRLVRVVARGAQGTVYEALEPRTGRRVAIKQLRDGSGGELSDREIARFERETSALAGLGHPNVVTLLAAPDDHGARLLVMEWIDGLPIDAWAARVFETRPPREAIQTVAQAIESIALGIAAAHARGVAHRDLKPSNVLVDTDGVPKILDFGIAVDISASSTQTGQTTTFAGTPSWAAPEQVAGAAARIDARVDVHALGLLLAATLSGRAPFDASLSMEALFAAIAHTPIAPPSRARKGVPRELDLVVAHATEKEPERRYPTAAAFADDLARWRRGEPVLAHPPELAYTARKFVRRHPVATTSALVATLLLTLTSVLAVRAALLERDAREAAVASEAEARNERDRAERMNDYFRALLAEVREKEDSKGATTARDLLSIASERLSREPLGDDARRDLHETLVDAYAALGDYHDAINEATDALALVTPDDDRSRGRILAALGSAQNRVGAGAEARTSLEEALRSFDRHDARRGAEPVPASVRISTLITLSDVHRKAARMDLAFATVDVARALMPPGISTERLDVLGFEAMLVSLGGDDEKAIAKARALIAEFEPHVAQSPLAYASLLHNAGSVANNLGLYDEALGYLTRAIALREEHREAAAPVMNTRVLKAAALSGLGDVGAAIEHLESCGELSGAPQRLRNRGIAGLYFRRDADGDLARARAAAIDGAGHFLGRDSNAGLLAAATLQLLGRVAVRESQVTSSDAGATADPLVRDQALLDAIGRIVEEFAARGADPLFRPYILGEIATSALQHSARSGEPDGWRAIERRIADGIGSMRAAGRGESSECLLAELFALQLHDRLRAASRASDGLTPAGNSRGDRAEDAEPDALADRERLLELERRAIGLLGERSTTVRRIAAERRSREQIPVATP